MASVWIARLIGKRGFTKLVAVKTILPKYASDVRFERMFLDEAGLAARIEHANVAQVLDLGEEHDVLFIAMELVDGDSLSKLLRVVQKKNQRIPPGMVLRILADACGGLHAAHELRGPDGAMLNVVHRDVSPQNILVSMSGNAKVIDFGIAKARDRMSEETSDGSLKGKVRYMAPEQALGKSVDRRADIFAVGAILYYLLAGKAPFEAENDVATLNLLSTGRSAPPLPPTVHPAVREVVRRALMIEPGLRYNTAAEMQSAIELAMAESKLMTTTPSVAAFMNDHMADRARKRKEALDMALSAAAQREKVAKMLERAGAESSSGVKPPGESSASGQRMPVVDSTYSTLLRGASLPREIEQPVTGEPSLTKLGQAVPVKPQVQTRPARRWAAGLLGALGLVAAGLVGAFVARRPPGNLAAVPPPVVAAAAVPVAETSHAAPLAPATGAPTADEGTPPDATPSSSAAATPGAAASAPRKPVAPPPVAHAAPKPAAAKPAEAEPAGKHRVNDGF